MALFIIIVSFFIFLLILTKLQAQIDGIEKREAFGRKEEQIQSEPTRKEFKKVKPNASTIETRSK